MNRDSDTNMFKESQWSVSLGNLQSIPPTIELKLVNFILKITWLVKRNWYQQIKRICGQCPWAASKVPPHNRAGTSQFQNQRHLICKEKLVPTYRISVVRIHGEPPQYNAHGRAGTSKFYNQKHVICKDKLVQHTPRISVVSVPGWHPKYFPTWSSWN